MRALDEAGLPVDLVGGTSIGAIMGGFLALGLDHEQRMRVAHEAFVRPDLVRYTLPLISLSSAREVTAGLRRHFGDTLIEDLWLRFLCVSVDLMAGEEVVHERGSVWHATRASISLPAVFPPVVDGERMLVDGGILNNTPVDHVASRLAGGTLIAVDLDNAGDAATEISPFPPDLSGWTVLRDRLAPGRPVPHMPGPIETLLRSRSVIAARVQRDIFATTRPDLHIHPRMGSHGLVDFRTAPQFVEAGYRATLEALENAPIRVP
jgi:predicted acylesterase/phospholipase RssA